MYIYINIYTHILLKQVYMYIYVRDEGKDIYDSHPIHITDKQLAISTFVPMTQLEIRPEPTSKLLRLNFSPSTLGGKVNFVTQ